MKNIGNNLLTLVQNNHIRWPALAALVCQLGGIWFPQYKSQFDATKLALLIYIATAASNATAKPQEK
jgi:hypothetical protein